MVVEEMPHTYQRCKRVHTAANPRHHANKFREYRGIGLDPIRLHHGQVMTRDIYWNGSLYSCTLCRHPPASIMQYPGQKTAHEMRGKKPFRTMLYRVCP